jgi:hypothetical protein
MAKVRLAGLNQTIPDSNISHFRAEKRRGLVEELLRLHA